jgi:hypothetical protein
VKLPLESTPNRPESKTPQMQPTTSTLSIYKKKNILKISFLFFFFFFFFSLSSYSNCIGIVASQMLQVGQQCRLHRCHQFNISQSIIHCQLFRQTCVRNTHLSMIGVVVIDLLFFLILLIFFFFFFTIINIIMTTHCVCCRFVVILITHTTSFAGTATALTVVVDLIRLLQCCMHGILRQ